MNKILLYAPCDGQINEISMLNDGVFSEKMLGDGFYISPSTFDFYSPIDNGTLEQVIDTKHAYFFSNLYKNVNLLMHIGLETVKYKGRPFRIKTFEGTDVNKDSLIVTMDTNSFGNDEVDLRSPVVFEISEYPELSFSLSKTGEVKRGEEIGYISVDESKVTEDASDELKPIYYKNRFQTMADEIYDYVGMKSNFTNVYNCFTRLRIKIKDKSLVNVDEIKKIKGAIGCIWSGDELQVIIGGDVYKVRDFFEKRKELPDSPKGSKYTTAKKPKVPFKAKMSSFITTVLIPLIPATIGMGMVTALVTVLGQCNLITIVPMGTVYANIIGVYDGWSVLFYCTSQVLFLMLMGMYMMNIVKFMKGNEYVALTIALVLAVPSFFYDTKNEIHLFSIGTWDIAIRSYCNSVFTMICAGIIYVYFDRWLKTWIPSVVDIIFRHALAILFTTIVCFLVVGPVFNYFENFIAKGANAIFNLPLGLSAGVLGVVWQVLVVFGMHQGFMLVLQVMLIPSFYRFEGITATFGIVISVWGFVGSGLAVAIRTKNSKLREQAIGASTTGFFGITEPLIYGILIQRPKMFIVGLFGIFCGGCFVGATTNGQFLYGGSGLGIFGISAPLSIYNPNPIRDMLFMILAMIITTALSCGIGVFVFKERLDEKQETNSLINKMIKVIINRKSITKSECNKEFKNDFTDLRKFWTKENIGKIKKLENYYQKLNSYNNKIDKYESNADKSKLKISRKSQKAFLKNNIEKLKHERHKFEMIDNNKKLKMYKSKLIEYKQLKEELESWLLNLQEDFVDYSKKSLQKISEYLDFKDINDMQNNFYNCCHSLNIAYGLTDELPVLFRNNQIKVKKPKKDKKEQVNAI